MKPNRSKTNFSVRSANFSCPKESSLTSKILYCDGGRLYSTTTQAEEAGSALRSALTSSRIMIIEDLDDAPPTYAGIRWQAAVKNACLMTFFS